MADYRAARKKEKQLEAAFEQQKEKFQAHFRKILIFERAAREKQRQLWDALDQQKEKCQAAWRRIGEQEEIEVQVLGRKTFKYIQEDDLDKMVPISLYGDGTPCSGVGKSWGKQFDFWSWSPRAKAKAAPRAVTMPHEESEAPRSILKSPAAIKPQAKGSSYGLTLLQLICAL